MKTQGLDDAFNVESSIVSADKNDVVKKPDRLTKDDIQKDYEYTRGNLYSIIEKGQEAINGILEKLKDVNEEQQQKGPSTVNNALFVGSTADLTKLLKNGVPKEDK